MNDIYSAPASDPIPEQSESIEVFTRFSTWYVVGLSIVTLSLYIPYWLYTRSKKLNLIAAKPIPDLFMHINVMLFLVSYALIVFADFLPQDESADLFIRFIDLASNIAVLVWVFMFRTQLRPFVESRGRSIGPVLTFFFQTFYLQYKINQILDNIALSREPTAVAEA